MTEIGVQKLGDIADIFSGYAFKSKDLTDHGIPVIKIKNVSGKTVSKNCDQCLPSELVTPKLHKYFLQPKDVLVAMTGQGSLGRFGRMTRLHGKFLVNQRVGIIRPKNDKVDPDYLFAALALDTYETQLFAIGMGAGQPNVSGKDIGSLEILLPEQSHQKIIGSIRKQIDLLIENNTRRIAILEEMGQTLYREWFVQNNYLPEDLVYKDLKEVCHLTMGQSPKSEYYNDVGEGLPFFQGVKDYGVRFPTATTWCSKPTRFAEKDDILFSVRAPVGRLNISPTKISIGRGLASIRHKENYQSFLFQQLKYIFNKEDIMGNGAIFNAVTKTDMQTIQLLCPSKDKLDKFADVLNPIFSQIEVLDLLNTNLKKQRDLLLPKLISGQIQLD